MCSDSISAGVSGHIRNQTRCVAIAQVVFGLIFSILIHVPLTMNTTCQPPSNATTLSSLPEGPSMSQEISTQSWLDSFPDLSGTHYWPHWDNVHQPNCTVWRYHQNDGLWYLYILLHAAIVKVFPIFFVGIFNVLIARHLRCISNRRTHLNSELSTSPGKQVPR